MKPSSLSPSPAKRTPQKSRELSTHRSSVSAKTLVNSLYFCHYRNAMYMGGIKSFQKHGTGILLHDDGFCILTNYYNDILHGHNIYFNNRVLVSCQYVKNRISEVVFRTDGFLVSLNYNADSQIDGNCLLLNYSTKTITYCVFKNNCLIQKKEEKDYTIINKVFQIGTLDFLIGKKHAKAVTYDIQHTGSISVHKIGNKVNIGYNKNGLMNGLGFSLLIRGSHGGLNLQTHRNQDQFQLKLVQRGYYMNAQLNGFGQKWFNNGNLYVGEFRNDVFEGSGVLKNAGKNNWVSGYFQKGNLVDLAQYNNEGDYKRCSKIVQSLHQRKTNWINNQIPSLNIDIFDKAIQMILNVVPKGFTKTLQQRKQQILKKIQRNFINDENDEESLVNRHLQSFSEYQNTSRSKQQTMVKQHENQEKLALMSNKKFIRSFIPQSYSNKVEQTPSNDYQFLFSQKNEKKSQTERTRQLNQFANQQRQQSDRKSTVKKNKIFQKIGSYSPSRLFNLHQIPLSESKLSTSPYKNLSKSRRKTRAIFDNSYNPKSSRREQYQGSPDAQSRINLSRKSQKLREKDALDSKRMIGRSQIFRHHNEESSQQPPKFNYVITKLSQDQNYQNSGSSRKKESITFVQ